MTSFIAPDSSSVEHPVNPFKEARESIIDPATGRSISHANLAKQIGCTKLSLIRLEQGTFNDPLPVVLNYFVNLGFNYLALTDGYIDYQHAMRRRSAFYFGDNLEFDTFSEEHPFSQLRNREGAVSRNQNQVSKELCIPQATINTFERDPRTQQSVPKIIVDVLHQLGYSDDQISSFLKGYKLWRQIVLGKNVVPLGLEQSNGE